MTNTPLPPDNGPPDDMSLALEKFDKLLNRGLDNVFKIENDEFIKGLSAGEIEKKISSDGLAHIDRSEFSTARKTGILNFTDDVHFVVGNPDQKPDDISIEELDSLKNVSPGQLVAFCLPDERFPGVLDEMLARYTQEYATNAGLSVQSDTSRVSLYAARHGKVVIALDMVYIVPADRDGACTVHVAPDCMEATIDLTAPMGNGTKLNYPQIHALLDQARVVRGIDRTTLDQAIEKTNTERISCAGIVVAKGQQPINGKDAIVTIHVPSENQDIGFKILPDGRIDYKKQASIRMVQSGDLLASVTDPEPGTEGFTVTGVPLPAASGSSDVIFEGEHVRKDKNGKKYYAECAGMISFHDKILNVFPVYQVNGDVDLKSGNIIFNGSVTIMGNVRSGFEVKASGDIFITGSTEAATIEAGRDIRINGAVVGGGNTIIRAGRNIFASHVQNAQLEAQGDITIVRSVMHSTIYSTGKLFLHDKDGSIVGGVINAMRGLETISIGSPLGTHTEIIIGSDFLIQRKKNELSEIAKFYAANISKIDMVLRPLMDLINKGIPLGAEKKRRLATIIDKRKSTDKQLRLINFRIKELMTIDPMSAEAAVIVQKKLYQDVTLKIAALSFTTTEMLQSVKCMLSADKKHIEFKKLNIINF